METATCNIEKARKNRSVPVKWIAAVFFFLIAMFIPFFLKEEPYYVHIIITVFIFGYLATAWGLVAGAQAAGIGRIFFGSYPITPASPLLHVPRRGPSPRSPLASCVSLHSRRRGGPARSPGRRARSYCPLWSTRSRRRFSSAAPRRCAGRL